jgi:hypothetical protein
MIFGRILLSTIERNREGWKLVLGSTLCGFKESNTLETDGLRKSIKKRMQTNDVLYSERMG